MVDIENEYNNRIQICCFNSCFTKEKLSEKVLKFKLNKQVHPLEGNKIVFIQK